MRFHIGPVIASVFGCCEYNNLKTEYCSKLRAPGHQVTRSPGHKDTRTQNNRIPEQQETETPRHRDTRTQGLQDTSTLQMIRKE
ncbi:hypothetical protein BgiBS90_026702 [Biomphalaria glabrata]|nr:hypothetical protein BgiBS90_026702 [Biomphalaria glabrata]